MYRGTTPSLIFRLNTELDLNTVDEVWLTIKGADKTTTWTSADLTIDATERTISLTLTQEETLAYKTGNADAQIRLLTSDGTALASSIVNLNINRILKEGIIE